MVVCDVVGKCDFDLVGGTVAVEFATLEVGVAFLDTVVNRWVDGRHSESLDFD